MVNRGDVTLGVERGRAAGAGRGDRLPVVVIHEIAAGEDAGPVRGVRPIAMNRPVTFSSSLSSVCVSTRVTPVSLSSPWIDSTVEFQANSIFGLGNARSCMIFEARSSLRRCTSVTLDANRERKVASSRAESPPPTTATCWSRRKNPSQVAHQLTP
jgi:hypothetical protein